MKFIDSNLQDHDGVNFKVLKDSNGITRMTFENGAAVRNTVDYAKIILGQCTDCDYLYKGYFEGFTYDKVLIAGLGFGLIPQTLSEVNNCSKVDVVEIDQEVIDYNASSNHLNSDITVIKGDIFEYTTSEKYDLIIIDTIWDGDEMSETQVQTLTSSFLNTNLNAGGVLYIPLKNKWLIKE
jgi:tRNA A58 N-methylase Trm61